MNKYVSPIIEIEVVEIEDVIAASLGENETGGLGGFTPVIPSNPNPGGGDDGGDEGGGDVDFPIIPTSLYGYFNS
jgi:hypothetical protein